MNRDPDGGNESNRPVQQARSLGTAWLVQTVTGLSVAAFGPLAPFLRAELGLTGTQLGLVESSLFFTSFFLLIPIGSLVDRVGAKRAMVFGQLEIGASFYLASLAPSFLALITAVTIAGIGTNATLPSTTKAIVTWFSERSRATAMGVKQTGFNVGGLAAAVTLPALAFVGGFRSALLAIGLFALLTGLISLLAYPTSQDDTRPRMATPFRETLAFLRNPDVLLFAFAAATFNVVQFSLLTYLVLYLNIVVLVPIAFAGVYLGIALASGAVSRVGWGIVSDRLLGGRRLEVLAIMAGGAIVSSLAIAALSPLTPAPVVIAVMVFTGLLFLGWSSVYLTVAGEIGGQREAGGSTGVIATLANVGILVGPPVFGFLVDSTSAFTVSWGFLTATMLVGLVVLIGLRKRGRIDHR